MGQSHRIRQRGTISSSLTTSIFVCWLVRMSFTGLSNTMWGIDILSWADLRTHGRLWGNTLCSTSVHVQKQIRGAPGIPYDEGSVDLYWPNEESEAVLINLGIIIHRLIQHNALKENDQLCSTGLFKGIVVNGINRSYCVMNSSHIQLSWMKVEGSTHVWGFGMVISC